MIMLSNAIFKDVPGKGLCALVARPTSSEVLDLDGMLGKTILINGGRFTVLGYDNPAGPGTEAGSVLLRVEIATS